MFEKKIVVKINLDRDYWNHFRNFMQKIQVFFYTFGKKTICPRHTPAQGCRLSPTLTTEAGVVTTYHQ